MTNAYHKLPLRSHGYGKLGEIEEVFLTREQIGLVVFGCVLFQQDRYGAGKHLWDISEQDYVKFIKVCLTRTIGSESLTGN